MIVDKHVMLLSLCIFKITANDERQIMCSIRKRQTKCRGQVMRKRTLDHLVAAGETEGQEAEGGRRLKPRELLQDTCDPGKWRVITAYACNSVTYIRIRIKLTGEHHSEGCILT